MNLGLIILAVVIVAISILNNFCAGPPDFEDYDTRTSACLFSAGRYERLKTRLDEENIPYREYSDLGANCLAWDEEYTAKVNQIEPEYNVVHFYSQERQEEFEKELQKAGIPYDVENRSEDRAYVEWERKYDERVWKIKGSPKPPGSTGFQPEDAPDFAKFLKKNDIAYTSLVEDGGMVWFLFEPEELARFQALTQAPGATE